MQNSFTMYNDPGHGWLKVPIELLKKLGIENKISSFSYKRGDFVYLEEDCDASLFIVELEKVNGKKIKIHEKHANNSSKIRNYELYKGE